MKIKNTNDNTKEKVKKFKERIELKDYSAPDPECLIKHKRIMREMKPHSELPGNDR